MKAKVIAIINQKGGVGKSTTAAALLAGLNKRGYKVLGVDLDPQTNFSYSIGGRTDSKTILGALLRENEVPDTIQKTNSGDLIAGSEALAGADGYLNMTGKEFRLKEALDTISKKYDFIIIDTPPSLGILTVNALTAANRVIIPAQADLFSFQGIEALVKTIDPIKRYFNHDLAISGILITRYSGRALLSRDMKDLLEKLAENLNTVLYKTTIREAIVVKEAQVNKESLFAYAPKANVTADYESFINELLEREGIGNGKKIN